MQEIRSSNTLVFTEICDPNKSPGRHHCSLKFGTKLKYRNSIRTCLTSFQLKIVKEHDQVKNEVNEQSVFRIPTNI